MLLEKPPGFLKKKKRKEKEKKNGVKVFFLSNFFQHIIEIFFIFEDFFLQNIQRKIKITMITTRTKNDFIYESNGKKKNLIRKIVTGVSEHLYGKWVISAALNAKKRTFNKLFVLAKREETDDPEIEFLFLLFLLLFVDSFVNTIIFDLLETFLMKLKISRFQFKVVLEEY